MCWLDVRSIMRPILVWSVFRSFTLSTKINVLFLLKINLHTDYMVS